MALKAHSMVALLPSQTQTFFTLRTVFTNIKQMFIEDSYAVFNVCKLNSEYNQPNFVMAVLQSSYKFLIGILTPPPSQNTNVYHMVVQCSQMFANIEHSLTVFHEHLFDICEDSSKCEKHLCLPGRWEDLVAFMVEASS